VSQGQAPWERPLGARMHDAGRVEFRVWAPRAHTVTVRLDGGAVEMACVGSGVYEAVVPARPGEDYWFELDGRPLPDPCSRWQPGGIRGPSRVFGPPDPPSPLSRPPRPEELVIYELHVGTFSRDGTFAGAIPYLGELAELGITAIELMPVAEFPGGRGWGYDGVYISAAQSSYGGPAGLLDLVTAAHQAGLAVILDVVYNHIGASGIKAFDAFGPYFTEEHETPWGRAINYDQEGSGAVREWVLQSATGWIRDFGIDGLRLDAIHSIFDAGPEHIVAEIAHRVHGVREDAVVIGEIGLDDPLRHGAPDCDAIWVDDFHHALHVLLTGERDGYYAPFGRVSQLADAFGHTPPERFVVYAQNHDQVGNRAFGDRLAPELRPLAAFCTVLSPMVPLLFMGEEYGEPAPFQFFSDHIDPEIAQATRRGRREEFAAFSSFGADGIPDPQDRETFERCKLTRERDPALARLYAELLAVRRELPRGEPDEVEFEESARWLRVRRGRFELVANFGSEPLALSAGGTTLRGGGTTLRLATSPSSTPEQLAPLSGALWERT
jgi:maltooligosyltrehalose trehalohydrolase